MPCLLRRPPTLVDPVLGPTCPASVLEPFQYLGAPTRAERQATSATIGAWALNRLVEQRRETVRRVESTFGLSFGHPELASTGKVTQGYAIVFPNSSAGVVEIVTPRSITTHQIPPRRPVLVGWPLTDHLPGHYVRVSVSFLPSVRPHSLPQLF